MTFWTVKFYLGVPELVSKANGEGRVTTALDSRTNSVKLIGFILGEEVSESLR